MSKFHATRGMSLDDKLDHYLDYSGGPDACWTWTGATDKDGYGRLTWQGRKQYAHRAAWVISRDEVPSGMLVLHQCDNPPCCNPAHLFLGTNADNMRDRDAKGRTADQAGEKNGSAKLTQQQADSIRETKGTYQTLASVFGVSPSTVWHIKKGRTWKPPGSKASGWRKPFNRPAERRT